MNLAIIPERDAEVEHDAEDAIRDRPVSPRSAVKKAAAVLARVGALMNRLGDISTVGHDVTSEAADFARGGDISNRFQAIRRSVDGAATLVEATDESALVQVFLRQRERALRARDTADAACHSERISIADLRRHVGDLERSIAQKGRALQHCPERERALERRCEAAEASVHQLRDEAKEIAALVSETAANAKGLGLDIAGLEQEHNAVVALQACARKALAGVFYFEQFKRSLALDCATADTELERTCQECGNVLAKLRDHWAEEEEKQRNEFEAWNATIGSLQEKCDTNRKESDAVLMQQADEWTRIMEDSRMKNGSTLQRMDELKRKRAAALREEVTKTKLQNEETEWRTKQRTQMQEAKLKTTYAVMAERDAAACRLAILNEHKCVEDAVLERKLWEEKALKTKRMYTDHAIKSGAYMRAIGLKGRMNLLEMASPLR